MKEFFARNTLYLAALLFACPALAETGGSTDTDVAAEVPMVIRQVISASYAKSRPDLVIESIGATPIPTVYAVKVANGPTLYTTQDGHYFVLGDLFEVIDGGFTNLAEKQREAGRVDKLAKVPEEEMIIFTSTEQPPKATIMVFTDVDCFYCQKLHKEVPDLNRIGIEVRYLAFPRAGIGSESYKKIATAWCAKDRQSALTKLKNRDSLPINVCSGNPVEKQYKLGNSVGVNGTPALLTADGRLMPGYMPSLQLAKALGVAVDPDVAAELAAKYAIQRQ